MREQPLKLPVQGFSLTDCNYDAAVEMLKERFGNPQQIIRAHMEGLIKIPNCVSDFPGSFC